MKYYYQDKWTTIYNCDCREILLQLEGELLITDPPYNVKKDYGIYKDDLPLEEYYSFMKQVIQYSYQITKKQFWIVPRSKLNFFLNQFPKNNLIILLRSTSTGPSVGNWIYDFLTFITTGSPIKLTSDVWKNIPLPSDGYYFHEENFNHPGYTPYKLATKAISTFTNKSIIDPFSGSGSILRAAKDLNIKSIGIEIDEKWCQIAAERMTQETVNFNQGKI